MPPRPPNIYAVKLSSGNTSVCPRGIGHYEGETEAEACEELAEKLESVAADARAYAKALRNADLAKQSHHRHSMRVSQERAFRGPVVPGDHPQYNERAHGGRSSMHVCACGAVRLINSNQGVSETGEWTEP